MLDRSVKKVSNGRFRGSTQEKQPVEIFRFDYEKASSDPAAAGVPDRVSSEGLLSL
jgi:hypothetical protein